MSCLRAARRKRRLYRFGEAHGRFAVSSGRHGSREGRLGRVEGQPFGDDDIVTSLDQADQRRLRRPSSFACEIRRVTGAAQEQLQFARPLLFLDLDERLQLAQVMGVAQGVQHARHGVIGLPVIVDDDAGDIGQKAAALGRDAIRRSAAPCRRHAAIASCRRSESRSRPCAGPAPRRCDPAPHLRSLESAGQSPG